MRRLVIPYALKIISTDRNIGKDQVAQITVQVVDENGIETVVPIELNEKELAELQKSSEVLKKVIAEFYPD